MLRLFLLGAAAVAALSAARATFAYDNNGVAISVGVMFLLIQLAWMVR